MTSTVTLRVPKDYGYVIFAASSTYILSMWLGMRVLPFRLAARVPYPHNLATQEAIANAASPEERRALYLFNCSQRAHYNFLEKYPATLASMLISGLRYPRITAVAALAWVVGRVLYAVGYTSSSESNVDGSGRWYGGGFYAAAVSQGVFLALNGKFGWDLLRA